MLRIVLSGGPCSGKTTSKSRVKTELSEKLGLNVFIVPEAATDIIQSGIYPGENISMEQFQEFVLVKQLENERMVLDAIEKYFDPNKSVVIYDRGILDQFAYVSKEFLIELLKKNGMTVEDVTARYDAIIHMVTAAKGTDVYTTENNAARRESAEEAIQVDERTLEGNMMHHNLHVVDNSTDFEQKVGKVLSIIFSLTEEFLDIQAPAPMEIERKFLIRKPDFGRKELQDATKSNIVQTYLRAPENSEVPYERRIRQRIRVSDTLDKPANHYMFTYTEKTPLPGNSMKRIERERILSMKEYVGLMSEADTNLHQICKDRYCFLYDGQYFELDIYEFPEILAGAIASLPEINEVPETIKVSVEDCAILEIELPDENTEVKIPEFIDVIAEVTDDERFKNHSIAGSLS